MKFRDFIQEATTRQKVIVVYGGGFQPFHAGHMSSYEQAKRAFPTADFYVAASNDTKTRPIPFKDKQFLAQQAGVKDNFVQVSQPVNPVEILKHYNPKKDILILVRSERDPVKYTKKDGSPAYYQPFKSLKECSSFDPEKGHGYIFVTKKHVFTVNGQEAYSGSQIRSMYSKADEKGKKNIIKDLYPKSTKPEKVKQLLDKYIGGLNEENYLNEAFDELLLEGVHDKSIFKAVFLAGGPGSGKDYVLDNTLSGHGLTEINSDKALEFLMDKEGLDKTMPASEEDKRNFVRGKAKNITELRQRLALLGRNGLIINGTGDDHEKIKKIKERLETVGYETSMLLVQTDDEVSKQRNIERGQRGGRTVPENIRKQKWDGVQAGRVEYAKMFGDNYMEFDNSEDLRTAPPEVVKQKKDEMLQLFTRMKDFVSKPPSNEIADAWVAMELQKKDTLPIPKDGAEQTPHPESGAADEARKLGLQYYGFGRYGKNGKVTHRSVHDRLVEVDQEQPSEPNLPTPGTSMKNSGQDDMKGRTSHQIGDNTIHVKINKKKSNIDEEFEFDFDDLLNEVVGQGGRDYETTVNDRLKKFGKARPDATTAGSSADAPDATFLHKGKEHNLEIKQNKGAMFGQMELHHNGKEWDASERSKKKYPATYQAIKKTDFFKKLNSQWKKPSGDYDKDLKMGNVYHEHPTADPIKAHYGKDRKTNYIQVGGGHGFYHTGNDEAGLKSPELHGTTQIRARMKYRGSDAKTGKKKYGALIVMGLKGDVAKSHHDLDIDPKKINEAQSLNESVTISITGDTVDEVHSMINSIQGYTLEVEDNQSNIDLSDKNESLTLGKHVQTIGEKQEELVVTNADMNNIFEEKKTKLLKDTSGKTRIFLLRRSAAKEAHTKGGEVMKHPKGYVIKIKEEIENDSIFQESVRNESRRTNTETSIGWSNSSSGRKMLTESRDTTTSTGVESGNYNTTEAAESIGTKSSEQGKTKITLAQIRAKQKEVTKESIDKGIEPGLSMASSGENMNRGLTKTKLIKKPLEEMQGDETTLSIGDQKEDELKKKGINLSSFKSKKVVG